MKAMEMRKLLTISIGIAMLGSACGGGDKKPAQPQSSSIAKPQTTPSFNRTSSQLKSALIDAKEVGPTMRDDAILLLSLRAKRAAMCSLSELSLDGRPAVITRQFLDPSDRKAEPRYAQLIAAYKDQQSATASFRKLEARVNSCPKKQHIPLKKVPNTNYYLRQHNDTWTASKSGIANWTHVRGFEKHVEPAGETKQNVFYFVYDYALQGNVVVTSLYWERTPPSDSGEGIAKKATEILTKQLQKIG